MRRRSSTVVELVRIAYGGCLFAAPALIPRVLLREETSPATRRVIRLLGARHIAQGAAILITGPRSRRLGVIADLLHLASLAPLAAISGRRKMCAGDAAIETLLAVADTIQR